MYVLKYICGLNGMADLWFSLVNVVRVVVKSGQVVVMSHQVKLSQVTVVFRLRTKTYQIVLINVCTRWHETPNIKTINNNPKDKQIANRGSYANSKSS